VDIPTRSLDRLFDYEIPRDLQGRVAVGVPVLVGFAGRQAIGYVAALAGESEFAPLQPLQAVVGPPLFAEHAVAVAEWIAEEYVAGLAEAVRLFLPPGGRPTVRRVDGPADAPPKTTTRAEYELVRPAAAPVETVWVQRRRSLGEPSVRAGATTQMAVLDALESGPLSMPELAAAVGDVRSAVRRLQELGLVTTDRRRRFRVDGPAPFAEERPTGLTPAQSTALETVLAGAPPAGVAVLDGVTASGKTEVYLRAVEACIGAGRSAIVLVPEISLTAQTVGRFRARFGDRVTAVHSRLSVGERYDRWELALRGEVSVVLGPRSALFAPLSDLGLVVVDEAHDQSYKQGSTPRYHARDVARRLCLETGATLVLGSATPSFETRTRAESEGWRVCELPKRVGGRPQPSVDVVDMAEEFGDGHKSIFSRQLLEALGKAEAAGEKALLLLNRRGFASFLLCRECGFVARCPSCAVSLSYHEAARSLRCHHCGHAESPPPTCPECDSAYLRKFGVGTERVEAELAAAFPSLPRVRMDADTTRGKTGHERRLAEFRALEHGVLVGTQMIAKGHHVPEVTLVGVVNADTALHLPEFRASERTFQLLTQVAGRAGRGESPGRVVVQTYWPDHPAILAAAAHDARSFYRDEGAVRRALGYPPFGRLASLLLTGRSLDGVSRSAAELADHLRSRAQDRFVVLGPAPRAVPRKKDVYRWHVLLKSPIGAELPQAIRVALESWRAAQGVSVAIDVDPEDLL
jgi:primosomal protein N' (replication factor Y)